MNGSLTEFERGIRNREGVLSGLVVYEDQITRDRAIRLCDHLMEVFWSDLSLEFTWWKFDYLREPGIARLGAEAGASADLVIFSAHAGKELPSHIELWIESWLKERERCTGAVVALIGLDGDPVRGLTPIHIYLREIAQRAGMDYLPQVLDDATGRVNVSVETINHRARKMTSLLDGILQHSPAPSRWGINE